MYVSTFQKNLRREGPYFQKKCLAVQVSNGLLYIFVYSPSCKDQNKCFFCSNVTRGAFDLPESELGFEIMILIHRFI